MLRTGARFSSIFQDAPQGSTIFLKKIQDSPHGSAIFEDALHGNAISLKIVRMLGTGARFSSKLGQLERSSPVWNSYRIHPFNAQILNDEVDESYTKTIPAEVDTALFEPRKPPRTKGTGTRLV